VASPRKNPYVLESSRQPSLSDVSATVGALIDMMASGNVGEVDVSVGDVSIRLRGVNAAPDHPPLVARDVELSEPPEPPPARHDHTITAPMIGTYYGSPTPGEPPFVQIGDVVEPGQVVGIIEAMKIMNEISADRGGVVIDILVTNAQAVEYGSPLLRLDLSGDQSG